MINNFLLIAMIIFFIFAMAWNKEGTLNFFCKIIMWFMFGWGAIATLMVNGFISK